MIKLTMSRHTLAALGPCAAATLEQGRPFPIAASITDTLEGYDTLRRLASSPAHIVPGHDPLVLQRYPAAGPGLEDTAVRLHADQTAV